MDEQLRIELLAMADEDQRILRELHDRGELGTVEYHPRMKNLHERHNDRIKEIIRAHGWPGADLVGKDGAAAAWLIVQHAVLDADFMESCVPLLTEAVCNQLAEGRHLAFLHDRVLAMAGKPQIYGTQFDIDPDGKAFPKPIKNPENVDKLRRELGLEPLTERTKHIQNREDQRRGNRIRNSLEQ